MKLIKVLPVGLGFKLSDETKDELITSINKLATIVCRSLISFKKLF